MKLSLLVYLLLAAPTKSTVYRLDNGLRVVFVEDRTLPVFLGFVQFDVGSCNESPGLTGTSHLLEHMLFKGTNKLGTVNYTAEAKLNMKLEKLYSILDTIPDDSRRKAIRDSISQVQNQLKDYIIPEEIWKIYGSHGGTMMNASTSNVSTQYFVLLPSNKKELWFKIESDRFKNLVLREFFSERDVVNEERRMRESNPYSKIWNTLISTTYVASPVRWSVIGWEDDISNVMPNQVMWYYKNNYTPDNCIIVLVGDVNPEDDLGLVKKYFGKWKGKKNTIHRYTREPEQNATMRAKIFGPGMPTLAIAFKGPYFPDKDYYALSIFSFIFGESEGSILKRTLSRKGVLLDGESFTLSWDGKAPALFGMYLYPASGISMDSLEKEVFWLLDSLRTSELDKTLLQKAKNNSKMLYIMSQKEYLSIAFTVATGLRVANDPEFYKKEIELIESITEEDIKAVLQKYIRKEKATIVTLGG